MLFYWSYLDAVVVPFLINASQKDFGSHGIEYAKLSWDEMRRLSRVTVDWQLSDAGHGYHGDRRRNANKRPAVYNPRGRWITLSAARRSKRRQSGPNVLWGVVLFMILPHSAPLSSSAASKAVQGHIHFILPWQGSSIKKRVQEIRLCSSWSSKQPNVVPGL